MTGGATGATRAHRWAGAWVELLPCAGRRVLLVETRPSRARLRLAERAGRVGVLVEHASEATAAGLNDRRLLPSALEDHLEETWDIVVVNGPPSAHRPERLGHAVAPGGRLVYVCGNRHSPIRRDEPALRTSWRQLTSALRLAGWAVERRFGLLRSAAVPTTAFDIDARLAGRAVLAAALVHLTGPRAAGVRWLSRLPPIAQTRLVPGWLVSAARAGEPVRTAAARTDAAARPDGSDLPVTGRMGYERTPDSKLLLGEPPKAMERTYAEPGGDDAEAAALDEMARAVPGVAPPLLARPRAGTLRMGWLPGHGLDVRTMGADDLVRWTEAAALLLRRIQDATARPDGSVLVHGDYWLGNLLIGDGGETWVIDWGDARRGPATVDREFLVSGLDGFRPLDSDLRRRLEQAVAGAFADADHRP